jgi:hypothetical protein
MRLQQALLHPHPMESNPAWAQTGVTMLQPRISFHRVRAQYQPAAILEQPLLVPSVSRDVPNARRFQGQTCSVSCENSKNIYIWYPDQDQSRVFWRSAKSSVFSHEQNRVITYFLKLIFLRVLLPKKNAGRVYDTYVSYSVYTTRTIQATRVGSSLLLRSSCTCPGRSFTAV